MPASHRALSPDTSSWRRSMAGLHIWAGLISGWLIFVIFLFGSASVFQHEISAWMRPELRNAPVTEVALDQAMALLTDAAPDAARWTVMLPPLRGGRPIQLSWTPREGQANGGGKTTLDPATGRKISVRDTRGGDFLYRFHYDLHAMPRVLARYLVGIAAMTMLLTLPSGIVIHKRILADFFRLRLGNGQRSWLDLHNRTAVIALPFHLMITYTGLTALALTLMPWAAEANFPNTASFQTTEPLTQPVVARSEQPAKLLSLTQLAGHAEAVWQDTRARYFGISNPGNASATVELWPIRNHPGATHEVIYLVGTTGAPAQMPPPQGSAMMTDHVMTNLHTGQFAQPPVRWLYFLSGLSGVAMVASGLVLWVVKRRARLSDPARPSFGIRLVEQLNIAVIAGAPAGLAAYFLANRILPPAMANRAGWEINSLFIVWGGVFIWALTRPVKRAWVEALASCAVLYALVPIVNSQTTVRGLGPSLIAQDWIFAGFDLAMLAMAAAYAFTACKIATHKAKTPPRSKTRMAVDEVA